MKIERHPEGGLIAEKQILEYHGGSMWEEGKVIMSDHHSLAYYKILFTQQATKHVIYVTTRKANLYTQLNDLEVDLQRKEQCVRELSACSQEQALKICDLVHVKYKQMDRSLSTVRAREKSEHHCSKQPFAHFRLSCLSFARSRSPSNELL